MSIKYSFVIPTKRSFDQFRPLLVSIARQTVPPAHIIIVYDHDATPEEFDRYRTLILAESLPSVVDIIHPLSDQHFLIDKGASYLRNYGRSKVKTPFMIFVDDDNTFDEDFVSKAFEYVGDRSLSKSSGYDHLLIVPIQYDDTTTFVRQSVADHFNFMLCRPRWITRQLIDTEDRYYHICLSSSNCLIGSTTLFTQFPFDEAVPFVYEDLIMTGRMSHSGVRIMCDTWISVAHAHGHRTKLAQLYINTPLNAYYKAKHRILFVHTIGKTRDKILFYLIGLPGQTAWLVSHILRYAPPKHRYGLVIALMRGTKDGIREAGRRS